jgi:GWxTD domain-containing protein
MKNKTILLASVLVLLLGTHLKALDLGVSYAVMATPTERYVEINLEIDPLSIFWSKIDSNRYQASADILILVKKGDVVVAYEKYTLNSPILEYYGNLLDVKRLAVPNGTYELEVTATDKLQEKNKARFARNITVDNTPGLYMAEIQLLRSFKEETSDNPLVKNGQYLEPMPFGFYDKNANILAFYTEMYYTGTVIKDPVYTMRFTIERDLGNGNRNLVSVGNQKKRPSTIDMLLVQMDISQLETGNYHITLELRNKANEVLAKREVDFQRSNPYLNISDAALSKESMSKEFVQNLTEKELRYSLSALTPNVSYGTEPEELKNIMLGQDLEAMRFFLFRYFVRQDANKPEEAWREYMETANAADKQFHSGFRYGFETDRGRTYMKYGRPDDLIHVEDDPAAPPYEIWVYYNFPKTKQRNVKFLFYNPSLAGEDYIILHSNARGEINNPKWEIALYKRNAGNQYEGDNDWDANSMQRNTNRNARVYFEDY